MAARAGWQVRLKASGVGVAVTAQATTMSGGNKIYTLTDPTRRVWDRAIAVVVKNGGTPVDPVADPYTINRLTGTVTFTNATVRTITFDITYLPMTAIAEGTDFDLSCVANNQDDSSFGDVDITRVQVEKDWSGTVGRWLSADTYFADAFNSGVPIVFEFSGDGGTTVEFRGWGLPNKKTAAASKKTLVTDGIGFEGAADADGRSFTWLV
jgi:hypothetical protein